MSKWVISNRAQKTWWLEHNITATLLHVGTHINTAKLLLLDKSDKISMYQTKPGFANNLLMLFLSMRVRVAWTETARMRDWGQNRWQGGV